ncbi:unnamed protein product [Oppiella nova]|uniref:Uncharacterized protein n=1 Tax=Oppiella nova TaxID=334625 RepID=A0A7R9LEH7_9ACAR|nr:unnamed protein product [Oppiella nova]CAG2162019.1 unnamed protein product [Oppiella nova]
MLQQLQLLKKRTAKQELTSRDDKQFRQDGRKVFKEVCPLVAKIISTQLEKNIAEADPDLVPIILDEFANTSSAGVIIALHRSADQVNDGEYGVLSSLKKEESYA